MSATWRETARKLASRPYSIKVLKDDSNSGQPLFLAMHPELEGCMAQGTTEEEALKNLDEFRVDYIEHLLENNLDVPNPASDSATSNNVIVVETKSETLPPSFGHVLDEIIQPQPRSELYIASLRTSA
jgi:predicted RNase H-like HicB family nuclease